MNYCANQKLQNLNSEWKPYEKCEYLGPEALTDQELIAVLLRTGSRGESSLELAGRVLSSGQPAGLTGLLHYSLPELMEMKGIGRVKGIELLCAGEISKRIWRRLAGTGDRSFDRPEQVAGFYMESLRHLEQEELHVMLLNSRNMFLRETLLFRGTVTMSIASTREIIREALRGGAVSIVLVHNHPSGDPSPSEADMAITANVMEAAKLMDIRFMDHLIIGDQVYYSFRERGLLE
ncbi:MAG: DNA repair protein RadC [Clostridium sp.]|nr:DNA repair protein RadC [Clostridium sp.]MBO6149705.1 DNA repair protein RadC [Clostridium sp.]